MEDGLYLQALGGERRALLIAEGALQDLGIWYERQPLPGDLYLARITRIERAIGAAFCTLGEGSDGILTEGQALPLRIVRAAAPGKGPKLAPARVTPALGAGPAPRLLKREADLLARFLRADPDAVFVDSPKWREALNLRGVRARIEPTGFPAAVANALEACVDALLQPEVRLVGGGSLLIEPSATLTAIDVNIGSGGRGAVPRASLDLNRLALQDVARHLRLRSLAGRILVDCLSEDSKTARAALAKAMRAALTGDPERVQVKGVTVTGLLEITRRRGLYAPLHELLLCQTAPELTLRAEASRLLRLLAGERRSRPGIRWRLVLAPDLHAYLEGLNDWPDTVRQLAQILPMEERSEARYRLSEM